VIPIVRVVAVVVLLGTAAALLVDPARLPLALRALKRTLARDRGLPPPAAAATGVPRWKRLLAFVLVLLAFAAAVL